MSKEHPSYVNPPIQEALCEIHFRLPEGLAWRPALLGEIFKRLQPDFPELEPVAQIGMQLQVGPGGVGQTMLPPQQRMRYKHRQRPLIVQVSSDVLAVNELPKYPGWEQMQTDVRAAWETVLEVVAPAAATRIGLRYINCIARQHASETAGDWLQASDYLPKAVLTSASGFIYRLETRPAAGERQIVTLGETLETKANGTKDIVFDLDCLVEADLGLSWKDLERHLRPLHDRAWLVFSASMTPRLEAAMKGGIQ